MVLVNVSIFTYNRILSIKILALMLIDKNDNLNGKSKINKIAKTFRFPYFSLKFIYFSTGTYIVLYDFISFYAYLMLFNQTNLIIFAKNSFYSIMLVIYFLCFLKI